MKKMAFELMELPELHVACVRNIGPYNTVGAAFGRLFAWAGPRGLVGQPGMKVVAVYHDDPDTTPPDKLRSDVCLTVPPETGTEGEVSLLTIPGGLFAVNHAEVLPAEFGEAWKKVNEWLGENGLEPDDRLCYENYLNDHQQHPEGRFIVDICQPVKRR